MLELVRLMISKHSLRVTLQPVDNAKNSKLKGAQYFSNGVAPLFYGVPVDEEVNCICNHIGVGLLVNGLKQPHFVSTYNVQYKFNGEMHSQQDGVTMGSLLDHYSRRALWLNFRTTN